MNALDRAFLFYLTLVVFFYVNGSEITEFSSFILTLEISDYHPPPAPSLQGGELKRLAYREWTYG